MYCCVYYYYPSWRVASEPRRLCALAAGEWRGPRGLCVCVCASGAFICVCDVLGGLPPFTVVLYVCSRTHNTQPATGLQPATCALRATACQRASAGCSYLLLRPARPGILAQTDRLEPPATSHQHTSSSR
jgi:hypothetical protein